MADRSSKKIFKYVGGHLQGAKFHWDENDADFHSHLIVWGHVIHDPKIIIYKSGKKKTEFAVRYCRGGHIIVMIFGDTPAADEAAMLKAKDRVVVVGMLHRHVYTNSLGERKKLRYIAPFFIIPCDRILEVLKTMVRITLSPSINKILDADEEDVFESGNDYYERLKEEEKNEKPEKHDGLDNWFV